MQWSFFSFCNRRTAFVFQTNTIGAQRDGQVSEGGQENLSWDAIWYSKGHVSSEGYTLEIAIPFFVLRFVPADELEMGILMARLIPDKNESVCWPSLSRDYEFNAVSQYGSLAALRDIRRGVDVEVKPYAVAGHSKSISSTENVGDVGLDAKWGITSNLTADLTLNTDFVQAHEP